ncbi:MAG: hypothetical protein KBD73_03490 [Candidatus Magasanikbacteria bacterium]|nr:hypothetical protein [Candidatus Magasanikbacteria bacterium]
MKKSISPAVIIGGLLVVAFIGAIIYKQNTPSRLDGFASCLKEKGAVFYGAFWCPHCQTQKKLFGNAERLLPYVECSTPDGQTQLQICVDKGIEGYPTWTFADGSRQSGEISLEELAKKTSCVLPN